jgi:hypothetical protein
MQTVSTALHVETKGTHGNSENIIRGRKRIQRNSQQRGVFDLGLFRTERFARWEEYIYMWTRFISCNISLIQCLKAYKNLLKKKSL